MTFTLGNKIMNVFQVSSGEDLFNSAFSKMKNTSQEIGRFFLDSYRYKC